MGAPRASCRAKAPRKASPAPVVSTAWTGSGGDRRAAARGGEGRANWPGGDHGGAGSEVAQGLRGVPGVWLRLAEDGRRFVLVDHEDVERGQDFCVDVGAGDEVADQAPGAGRDEHGVQGRGGEVELRDRGA
jgi:hypothetical protein